MFRRSLVRLGGWHMEIMEQNAQLVAVEAVSNHVEDELVVSLV